MTPILTDKAMASHTAVVGMTGSGKSSSSRVVVEYGYELGERICILDTVKSDWHGIVSNFAGDGPGLPFQILGGPYGHVPLAPTAGAQIAYLVAHGKLPYSVIDMSLFPMGGMHHFYNDFCPALMREMRGRGILRLMVEEAHELAPKEKAGVAGESVGVYNTKKLATAGRSLGLRMLFATQRTQALHNAVLGSCSTVIAHRMQFPADQAPVVKWLSGTIKDKKVVAAIDASMSELADGEAWICSAGVVERRQMPRMWTFDSGRTPVQGEQQQQPVVQSAVDVAKLRKLIGAVVEEAEANDVPALRARIKELEVVVAAGAMGPNALQIKLASDKAYKDGYDTGTMHATGKWQSERAVMAERLHEVGKHLMSVIIDLEGMPVPREPSVEVPQGIVSRPDVKAGQEALNREVADGLQNLTAAHVSPSARAILNAIHGAAPLTLSFDAAARRAGISKRSSAYRQYKQQVESRLGVEIDAIDGGRYRSLRPNSVPDVGSSVNVWISRLPPSAGRMLSAVIDGAQSGSTKAQIAARAGISPTSSGLGSGLRELQDLELIVLTEDGRYRGAAGLKA